MKLFEAIINRQIAGQILLSIFVGHLVGLGIFCIDIFGSSQNAPMICAMASGVYSLARLTNLTKVVKRFNCQHDDLKCITQNVQL